MSLIEKAVQKQLVDVSRNKLGQDNVGKDVEMPYLLDNVFTDLDRSELVLDTDLSTDSVVHDNSPVLSEGKEFSPRVTTQEIVLDLYKLKEGGIIAPSLPDKRTLEELRVIKRRLLINASGLGEKAIENGNLIMVTSAAPGEGKTFLSVNLALSIAMEIDRTVLLVDADVAKSDVTQVLGIEQKLGLSDLLSRSDLDLPDVLIKTNIGKLSILPAGTRSSNTPEQIASSKMSGLILQMAKRYSDRIIIFDSPPLLATSESAILAGLMGQLVVVVESEKTKQADLLDAFEQLDPSKAIGLVLNKCVEKTEIGYYEYYQNL